MARMSLQAAYQQARQWLESNDLDRAIGLAEHVLETYPSNLEAYRILGEAHLALRQLDRAQGAFEHVLRADPENIPAHVGLGITFERRGQLERAVAEFEQALEIKPDMPELRSQLLRLYAEAWGSENAQLRLSRAGLARLYAKGHMLPQAIAEFRQVLADQPERADARVALAETLWRNEQEDEAADVCREILAQRPESLKANLILGYLDLAAGRPEGERSWQAAYQMDPYQTVAQALFETLPPAPEEPTLPEWDENAWRRRRDEALHEEQIAATRPMESTTLVLDDERDTPVLRPSPVAPAAPAPFAAPDEDDFLASLLALDTSTASAPEAPPAPPAPQPVAPAPQAEAAAPAEDEDLGLEDLGMTPFSLADLGLSEDEIAGLEGAAATPPAAPAEAEPVPAAPEPAAPAEAEPEIDTTPFSLADLGLSEDEIAGLESIDDLSAVAPEPAAPAEAEPEIDMTPFSLADLGLSEDEISGLESLQPGETPPAADADLDLGDLPADLQPFSMDELDLGGASEDIGELPSSLQPFSLEDAQPPPERPRVSGLPADEPFEGTPEDEEALPGPRGFSWQQPSQRPEPGFVSSMRSEQELPQGSIFEKLQQTRPTPPASEPPPTPPVAEDEHLGLFSLDNISLREDELTHDEAAAAPAESPPPAPEVESLEEGLASGAIQPFSFADLGLSDEEIAALGLGAAAATPEMPPAAPAAEPTPEAVSPEEPPAETPPAEPALEVESHEGPAAEVPAPEVESLEEGLASGAIQPFSFADLGLSDEEIAALGLGEPAPEAPAAEPAQEPEAEPLDLGLEDVAPFGFELGEAESAEQPPSAPEGAEDDLLATGELKPFSLHDLGLSDEEIADLGLDLGEDEGARLGLTEEELAGLASGGDVDWSKVSLSETPVTPPAAPEGRPEQVISGDLVVDRLIALGREQGFIDISDIIAAVEDPEQEADRIEEIGQMLHTAGIEIRDGDEVIDLDAEYEEDEGIEPAVQVAGEELTPFSLHDLGLTDEEIAMLGLGAEEAPAAETPGAETPAPGEVERPSGELDALDLADAAPPAPAPAEEIGELAPFSLSELGLSDEEIAMLGLGESAAEAPPAPEQPAARPPAAPPEPAPVPMAETPAAPPVTPAPVAPAAAPARPAAESEAPIYTGNEVLDMFVRQLEADPQNHVLRLAIARVGAQASMDELAFQHYRDLIKRGALLDDVVADLSDLIAEGGDDRVLRRLHKTLGDAYSKQGRFNEAVTEYSWTSSGPRSTK